MIGPPSNTQIWIAAGVTDLRRGFDGLSGLVQNKLEKSPLSGQVFIFRGRRGDLVKLIWFDGDGLCLFSKRLEEMNVSVRGRPRLTFHQNRSLRHEFMALRRVQALFPR